MFRYLTKQEAPASLLEGLQQCDIQYVYNKNTGQVHVFGRSSENINNTENICRNVLRRFTPETKEIFEWECNFLEDDKVKGIVAFGEGMVGFWIERQRKFEEKLEFIEENEEREEADNMNKEGEFLLLAKCCQNNKSLPLMSTTQITPHFPYFHSLLSAEISFLEFYNNKCIVLERMIKNNKRSEAEATKFEIEVTYLWLNGEEKDKVNIESIDIYHCGYESGFGRGLIIHMAERGAENNIGMQKEQQECNKINAAWDGKNPMLILYNPICAVPQHMLLADVPRQLQFFILQMVPKNVGVNQMKKMPITVLNYLMDSESEEEDFKEEIIANLIQETVESYNERYPFKNEINLLAVCVQQHRYKLIKIVLKLNDRKAEAVGVSSIEKGVLDVIVGVGFVNRYAVLTFLKSSEGEEYSMKIFACINDKYTEVNSLKLESYKSNKYQLPILLGPSQSSFFRILLWGESKLVVEELVGKDVIYLSLLEKMLGSGVVEGFGRCLLELL